MKLDDIQTRINTIWMKPEQDLRVSNPPYVLTTDDALCRVIQIIQDIQIYLKEKELESNHQEHA